MTELAGDGSDTGASDAPEPTENAPEPPADAELETMRPNPAWDAAAHEATVAALGADDYVFRVWGGDWCPDCRRQLPDFAAALDAAGVDEERILQYPVEKDDEGDKVGPGMNPFDVRFIPTVVVESPDGTELARFVEDADVPIAVALAEQLEG